MKKLLNTKKKKIIFALVILVIIVALAIVLPIALDKGTEVEVAKVERNNVESHYNTSGTITSTSYDKYYAYEGMVAVEVNVAPGDIVHKGDVLATFDTATLDAAVKEKKQAYNEARSQYNTALKNKDDAAAQEAELDKQIAELEASTSSSSTTDFSNMSEAEIAAYISAASSNTSTMDTSSMQLLLLKAEKALLGLTDSTSSLLSAYKTSMDNAKAEYEEILAERDNYKNGLIANKDGKVTDVYLTVGTAYEVVEESSDTDLSSLLSGVSSSTDISSLLGTLGTSSDDAQKGVAITIDYFDGYVIEFSIGKYDIETIKTKMPVSITYLDYEYEGEVSYVSATANSSTNMVSSLMGSTSTTTSAVAATILITNPDDKIVAGFEAQASILIDSKENVLTIPVESLVIKESKTYVYVIDEETSTAKLQSVEVGIYSDTLYEIVSGLNEGDTVILNASKIEEGEKVFVGEN